MVTEHFSHSLLFGLEREDVLGMLAMMEWFLLAVSGDFLGAVSPGSKIQYL